MRFDAEHSDIHSAPTRSIRGIDRQRWRSSYFVVALLVVAAGLGAIAAFKPTPALDRYQTAIIGKGDIEESVTALGKLQPRAYVDVGAQVSGQLTHIYVNAGDHVTAGQLLVEIDPQLQLAKIEVDQAESDRLTADLAEQQAQLTYAISEFNRQTRLQSSAAGREDLYQQAQRDMQATMARMQSIKAQQRQIASTLKADRVQLEYTRIYAPMTGTVVSVDAKQGQTINANYETPTLLRIADLTSMTAWTQVSEADVMRLHAGMALYFKTLGDDMQIWRGHLRQILPAPPRPQSASTANGSQPEPSVSADNVVLYTALFDVDNTSGQLRPGMTAQVSFIVAEAKGAILVPLAALKADQAQSSYKATVVTATGELISRTVIIGIKDRFSGEVREGLQPGDQVVTGERPDTDENGSLLGFRL